MADISLGELKKLVVENCILRVPPDEIHEDTPLFGPKGIGLDSLDALQITVAIEKHYGIVINDAEVARQVMESLGALRRWLAQQPRPGAKQ